MSFLLDPRFWLAALLALGLTWCTAERRGDAAGDARVQAAWDKASTQQLAAARREEADNRTIEFNRLEVTNAAQERARLRSIQSAARASAAAVESAGLRDDRAAALAALGSDLSAQSAATCRRYAATLDSVFGDVEAEGAEMARTAEGHASDSLMFQEAWPSNNSPKQ